MLKAPSPESTTQFHLETKNAVALPRLAWLSSCDLHSLKISLQHGRDVETHDEWAVEGVWDAPFAGGAFAQSPHFFGSGVRIAGSRVEFTPSSSLTDRLLYCTLNDCLLVSNSLPLLLAQTGARLRHPHNYRPEIKAVQKGLSVYEPELTVDHPEIESFSQLFHHHLIIEQTDGAKQPSMRIAEKPRAEFVPTTFEAYEAYLLESLERLLDNAKSSDRAAPMDTIACLSSGYDSTAVSTLAQRLGETQSYSVRKPLTLLDRLLPGRRADDGAAARVALGLEGTPHSLGRTAEDELHFHSAASEPAETAFYPLFASRCESSPPLVMLSGYHGDKVWDRNPGERFINENMRRGDMSGLPLSEARLHAGVINLALPFILAEHIEQLVSIANSDAMVPWRTNSGYDRPIPRRIAESAGVPRDSFGQRKSAVTRYVHLPHNAELRARYLRWVEAQGGSPLKLRLKVVAEFAIYYVKRALRRPAAKGNRQAQNQMFIWAANAHADELREALEESGGC